MCQGQIIKKYFFDLTNLLALRDPRKLVQKIMDINFGTMLRLIPELINFQPPDCNRIPGVRRRRQIGNSTEEEGAPATIEVYSGLYVNEASDGKNDIIDQVQKEKVNKPNFPH